MDTVLIHFASAEGSATALEAAAHSLADVFNDFTSTAFTLLSDPNIQGGYRSVLENRLDTLHRQFSFVAQEYDEAARDLLVVLDKYHQLDAECAALFGTTLAQRVAAAYGIQWLGSLIRPPQMVFAAGEVLGVSTMDVSLNPNDYPYDYHRRIVNDILGLQNDLTDQQNFEAQLRQQLSDYRDFIRGIEDHLNGNIVVRILDDIVGADDVYREIITNSGATIQTYENLIARSEQRQLEIAQAVEDLKPKLGLPGNPDVWQPLASQPGNMQSYFSGCTAFVASQMYIPHWNSPPGSADQWAGYARQFAADHPEYGMSVDGTATVGSVVSWPWTHVAVVRQIDPADPNHILIAEADTRKNAQGQWDQPWGTWINERETWIYLTDSPYNDRPSFIHMPWNELHP